MIDGLLDRVRRGEDGVTGYSGEPGNTTDALRARVNETVGAWLRAEARYLVVTDEQVRDRIDSAIREALAEQIGVTPGAVDIVTEIEVVRPEPGTIGYAFRFDPVLN
jgi:hypothetical protein